MQQSVFCVAAKEKAGLRGLHRFEKFFVHILCVSARRTTDERNASIDYYGNGIISLLAHIADVKVYKVKFRFGCL